ncbi:PadR family transcriptional regulator [Terribacillus saccharophilus]|uniref:PadR family transcriptional regulator n=1 Tax=Terribacillus saccharophilus TaxID=361277 RepID=UPI000BA73588|nr:PadR family transcriptional regulator [Terribacillus saccharophilus]PAF18190.1 PadR family transcriptional regulator [Terribacillus saccharophilus]
MRVLKYAILGLLEQEKRTGYDIAAAFKGALGQFWSAKHSQIYPELKKLVAEGLIEFETVIQGEKLEKKLYSLTVTGEAELKGWMQRLEAVDFSHKDEFMLKIFFISSMEKEEAKELFSNQLVSRKRKLDELGRTLGELEAEFSSNMLFSSPEFGHYLVLTRAIEREKGYIQWLERSLQFMD